MNFLKDLFNSDRIKVAKENQHMRLSKKNLEKELETEKLKGNEIKDKYIAVLEEKCDGFDKYVHFEEESIKLADDKRELKKELAQANEKITSQEEIISQQEKTISKLQKKLTKSNETK